MSDQSEDLYDRLRSLNSSKRISEQFSLEELIAAARAYQALSEKLSKERCDMETEVTRLRAAIACVREEEARTSFGTALVSAIGVKLRDESEAASN